SPATVASAGRRYFGFVTGGSLPAALAANWLAGAWDQNAAMVVSAPVAAKLEQVTLGWLREVLALPPGTGGGFVTGATMANFTGLATARHAVLEEAGWNVETDGLFGAPPITVVVGDEVHSSLVKALGLLRLGRERVVRVPVAAQGRMRPDALPPLSGPTIVRCQSGNVNTGAFPALGDTAALADGGGACVPAASELAVWASAGRLPAGRPAGRAAVAGRTRAVRRRTRGPRCSPGVSGPPCCIRPARSAMGAAISR